MKYYLIVATLILFIISCKRKQNLVELNSTQTLVEYPTTCYNGLLDGDETYIDCGGSCGDCKYVVPTCTANNNTLLIGTTTYSTISTSCLTQSNGKFSFSGSIVGGGSYNITLGSSTPNLFAPYTISGLSTPSSANDAVVSINPTSISLNDCDGGKVFINKISGKYYITICNATAWSNGWTPTQHTITGKVTCQ